MTETAEVTITGVLSNNLMGPTVDFFPLAPPALVEMVQSETGWSHEIVINYKYDPLRRVRQALYNYGRQFDYTYDAVGNRLTQTVDQGPGNPVVTDYQYDSANRLIKVDSQDYTWDNNGNLLNDGVNIYSYDHANRMISANVSGEPYTAFVYNGLGDRLEQIVDLHSTKYSLDLAGGLTQVLSDGTHTYLYGNGRIGEELFTGWQYHLGDGLGSVRQLTNQTGSVALVKGYEPYGEVLDSAGNSSTAYGFTGEWTDHTGLVYLRARYYDPIIARFMTKDTWGGDKNQPMSYNSWLYANSNPMIFTDPSGHYGQPQVHYALTLELARKIGKLYCQYHGCVYANALSTIIANGDSHMDDFGFWAIPIIGHPEIHFSDKTTAYRWAQSAVNIGEPYLFGASLHSIQDWYSHYNEGYRWPGTLGHLMPTATAEMRSVELMGEFYQNYPPNTVKAMLSVFYSASDIAGITDNDLIDLFLRTFTKPGDNQREKYGYNTDLYFSFTSRDQNMARDTQDWLIRFYNSFRPNICFLWEILTGLYTPPSDSEINLFFTTGHP